MADAGSGGAPLGGPSRLTSTDTTPEPVIAPTRGGVGEQRGPRDDHLVTESETQADTSPATPVAASRTRRVWRWVAVGVLLTLAAVLLLGAFVSRYARSQVLDTDRYVETVAPLASDPAVQQEITNQLTDAIFARVDVEALTEDALTSLEGAVPSGDGDGTLARVLGALVTRLTPVIASQLENVAREQIGRFVASNEFATAWADANRIAHDGVVAVLTGEREGAITVSSTGTVTVNLAPIVETVRQRLINRGFSFAERIPDVDAQFVIFQSAELAQAREWTDRLNRWATWLPWLALLFMLAAVLVAPNRRRALLILGCVIVFVMALLAVGVRVGRAAYLDAVPPDVMSQPTAEAVFDIMAAPLRQAGWATLALGLVLIVGAYLAGPSAIGRAVRSPINRLLPEPVTGGAAEFVRRYRFGITAAVLFGAGAVLLLWRYPTALVVIGVAILTLVLLVLIRWVAGPSLPGTAQTGGAVPVPSA